MSTQITVFRPNSAGTVNLAATAASSRVLVFVTAPAVNTEASIRVYNAGTAVMFIEFGDVTVTASLTTGTPIASGATEVFRIASSTSQQYAAAITGTNGTIYFTPGHGA